MSKLDNRGFSPVTVLLLVAIVALIGFAGWTVYNNQQEADSDNDAGTQNTAQQEPIENAEDLDAANDELNSQDIDAQLDTSEIDQALSE